MSLNWENILNQIVDGENSSEVNEISNIIGEYSEEIENSNENKSNKSIIKLINILKEKKELIDNVIIDLNNEKNNELNGNQVVLGKKVLGSGLVELFAVLDTNQVVFKNDLKNLGDLLFENNKETNLFKFLMNNTKNKSVINSLSFLKTCNVSDENMKTYLENNKSIRGTYGANKLNYNPIEIINKIDPVFFSDNNNFLTIMDYFCSHKAVNILDDLTKIKNKSNIVELFELVFNNNRNTYSSNFQEELKFMEEIFKKEDFNKLRNSFENNLKETNTIFEEKNNTSIMSKPLVIYILSKDKIVLQKKYDSVLKIIENNEFNEDKTLLENTKKMLKKVDINIPETANEIDLLEESLRQSIKSKIEGEKIKESIKKDKFQYKINERNVHKIVYEELCNMERKGEGLLNENLMMELLQEFDTRSVSTILRDCVEDLGNDGIYVDYKEIHQDIMFFAKNNKEFKFKNKMLSDLEVCEELLINLEKQEKKKLYTQILNESLKVLKKEIKNSSNLIETYFTHQEVFYKLKDILTSGEIITLIDIQKNKYSEKEMIDIIDKSVKFHSIDKDAFVGFFNKILEKQLLSSDVIEMDNQFLESCFYKKLYEHPLAELIKLENELEELKGSDHLFEKKDISFFIDKNMDFQDAVLFEDGEYIRGMIDFNKKSMEDFSKRRKIKEKQIVALKAKVGDNILGKESLDILKILKNLDGNIRLSNAQKEVLANIVKQYFEKNNEMPEQLNKIKIIPLDESFIIDVAALLHKNTNFNKEKYIANILSQANVFEHISDYHLSEFLQKTKVNRFILFQELVIASNNNLKGIKENLLLEMIPKNINYWNNEEFVLKFSSFLENLKSTLRNKVISNLPDMVESVFNHFKNNNVENWGAALREVLMLQKLDDKEVSIAKKKKI